jgi:tripartite ATP-independent transporter DctM subunit
MEWWLVLIIMFGGMFVLLSIGLPVAFSFLLVNLVGGIIYLGGAKGLVQIVYSSMETVMIFTLLPVPLFIFMGEIMFQTRLGLLAIDTVDELLGRVPGRLSLLSIGAGTIIGALCGSSLASTALLGKTLLPEMRSKGYSKFMSLGPIITAGSLAMVIPPTALGVLIASLTQVSIGHFLIGCFIPGLVLASIYSVYVVIMCVSKPCLAPPYIVERKSLLKKVLSIGINIVPMAIIVFLVTVTIYIGICTPSEAAALGTGGTLFLAIVYRQLTWDSLKRAVDGTLQTTVMIFFILFTSSAFSQILAFSGAGRGLTEAVLGTSLGPMQMIIAMQLLVIVLGCFMDQLSILMITLPIFMPLVHAIGFNDMVFAMMLLINVEMAGKTPPFGMSLFVMKGVAPADVTSEDIYKSVAPFLLLDMVMIGLLLIFPSLALWLPSIMK